MKKSRRFVIVMVVLFIALAITTTAYAASYTRYINQNCSHGAAVGVTASGIVTVKFNALWFGWLPVSTTVMQDLGPGKSAIISADGNAKFTSVEVNIPDNSRWKIVSSAYCR